MPRDGALQKNMLVSMAASNNMSALNLARIFYQTGEPTKNQMRATHRAIMRLLEKGEIVQSPYRNDKGDRCFSLPGGARKQIKRSLTAVK